MGQPTDKLGLTDCYPISFFFFNDTATTEIYTLSLHDALPTYRLQSHDNLVSRRRHTRLSCDWSRSEEHTSELQSHDHLVCRLLLEKTRTSSQTPNWADCCRTRASHSRWWLPCSMCHRKPQPRSSGNRSFPPPSSLFFFFERPGDPRNPPLSPTRRFSN